MPGNTIITKRIKFISHHNEELTGKISFPANGIVKHTAIFAHCFTCSKESIAAKKVSASLSDKGFAVLRFDFTGLGDSTGEFKKTNYSTNVSDIVAAAEYLTEKYSAPSMLIGHSFGGSAVLAASTKIDSIKAVVTIAAPSEPKHVEHLFSDSIQKIKEKGEAEVYLTGRKFTINKKFLDDIESQKLQEILPKLGKALLIFHAPEDELVNISHAQSIYNWAKHPKSFVSLSGANHMLTNAKDAIYVSNIIDSWSQRYLEAPILSEEIPAKGIVRVKEINPNMLLQRIITESNSWYADEPKNEGGNDSAPSPFQLLLSALGACTTMTSRIYARKKGYDFGNLEVDLDFSKKPSTREGAIGVKNGFHYKISRRIRINGEVSDEMKMKILQIVDKCPVHKVISAAPEIATVWDEG